MDMLRVLWLEISHFRVRIHHYIEPTNYDFQLPFPILLLFCFVSSFFQDQWYEFECVLQVHQLLIDKNHFHHETNFRSSATI